MGSLKIDVFNSSFTINATEDDAYLQKLLGYYKKIISQIQQSGSLSNPVQRSALAGIMLCDELYKEKSKLQMISQNSENSESEIQEKKVEKLTKEMIEKINRALS